MAGADAGAAIRHDRDTTGRLHRDGQGEGFETLAHPSGACAEAVLPDVRDGDRHQYRPADRWCCTGRDDLCAPRHWPAADRRAINTRDFVVLQGVVLFIATGFVLVNFVVDMLYGIHDPRIRL